MPPGTPTTQWRLFIKSVALALKCPYSRAKVTEPRDRAQHKRDVEKAVLAARKRAEPSARVM